jgi:hypothetical protein
MDLDPHIAIVIAITCGAGYLMTVSELRQAATGTRVPRLHGLLVPGTGPFLQIGRHRARRIA